MIGPRDRKGRAVMAFPRFLLVTIWVLLIVGCATCWWFVYVVGVFILDSI